MSPDLLPPRIAAKIRVDDSGCWLWIAAKQWGGYGVCHWDGAGRAAHRVTYALLVGPIPEGHDLHHVCGVVACVNPSHLVPMLPAKNRGRTDPRPSHISSWPVSRGSYNRGCRCADCYAADRRYHRERLPA